MLKTKKFVNPMTPWIKWETSYELTKMFTTHASDKSIVLRIYKKLL